MEHMRNFDVMPDTAHLTDKEIASWLGISKATVWRWVSIGTLPQPKRFSARCTRWLCGDVRRAVGISATNEFGRAA